MEKADRKVKPWEMEMSRGEADAVERAYTEVRAEQQREWMQRSLAAAHAEMERLRRKEPWRDLAVEAGPEYRVEGESGFWSFTTHRIVNKAGGRVLYDTRRNLPKQRGNGRCRTAGARELMLFLGAGSRPVQETVAMLNRLRHQNEKLAATTLRDLVEEEGTAISREMERLTALELAQPPPAIVRPPLLHAGSVEAAFAAAEIPDELLAEAKANPVPFTPPDATAYVAPDAVSCKKQKEHRRATPDQGGKSPGGKEARKTVSVCCATVRASGRRIALTALNYAQLALIALATLRTNDLTSRHCCLLLDGEVKLIDAFKSVLALTVGSLQVVLDWHHLDKRCSQLFSLALKGKDIRNAHREKLLSFLWHGCVNSALAYILNLPHGDIKSPRHIAELITYIEKRRDQIPVYSVRKVLGLSNSSNSVEKANDRLVSSRQKGKGMSWSQDGSFAFAAIRMVDFNGQRRLWLEKREISLNCLEKAAGF